MHEAKGPSSPAKASTRGKQRDESRQFGWWDFVPLVDRKRSPIQWTGSSTILTAHPQDPRVVGLCFPSSKQFTLPSPPPLAPTGNPQFYDPPSIIVASAQDTWVFAYFQGNIDAAQSVGCLWKRGDQVDAWHVKDWWTFERGAGIVQARWLNPGREWVISESLAPSRLPHIGPVLPFEHPILLVVTENHVCKVHYIHPQTQSTKMVSGSLCRPSTSKDNEGRPSGEHVDGPRGLGRCTHAAIGFTYDEPSILIATHSSFTPSTSSDAMASTSSDPLTGFPMPTGEPNLTSDWDKWRDDNTIELCEVKLSVESFALVLSTNPQAPIRMYPPPNRTLVDLIFIPRLHQNPPSVPSTPTPKHRLVTPTSSPALTHLSTPHSPEKGNPRSAVRTAGPSKPGSEKSKPKRSGFLSLLCTSLDFGDYSSPPSSEITQFLLIVASERTATNEPSKQSWLHRRERSPRIDNGVVVNMTPVQATTLPQHVGVLVSVIHTGGSIIKKKEGEQMSVGKFHVLRADLQIDENWETTNIICPVGSSPPLSIAVSPNRALIAAAGTSVTFDSRPSIYLHPARLFPQEQRPEQLTSTVKWWSATLSTSMQRRSSPNDIVHFLSMPGTSQYHIDVITQAIQELDNGSHSLDIAQVIGATAEVFKMKANHTKAEKDKEALMTHFQLGLELCSMVACSSAWEQCIEESGEYDLDEIWHLVGSCGWFIDTVSAILRECVILDNARKDEKNTQSGTTSNSTGSHPVLPKVTVDSTDKNKDSTMNENEAQLASGLSCKLLHLLHPFPFTHLLGVLQHVKRFYALLKDLHPRTENASIARQMFMELVETSGIDLNALENSLLELKEEIRSFADRSPDVTRRCLATLQPLPVCLALQDRIVAKLAQARVVDKATVFLKPNDIVDGVLGLTLNSASRKKRRDVIRMTALSNLNQTVSCLRCGGETELIPFIPIHMTRSRRWLTWEHNWQNHCVCGGLWGTNTASLF